VSRELDWDAFEAGFVERLAKAFGAEAVECPWPEFAEHEVEGLVEQYSSEEWNGFR
jgi:lipoate-protein ligase A